MITIEKPEILKAFNRFGLYMFMILIIKAIRFIIVLIFTAFIETDILDFIFGTITVILVLLACLNFSQIPKIEVNKEFKLFWLLFLFGHILEYLLITLNAFVYPFITSNDVAIFFLMLVSMFYLVIGMIFYGSTDKLNSYFEIKQVQFEESRKKDADLGIKLLMAGFFLHFLWFFIITIFIAVIIEYIGYYMLGKFRTLSIESEQLRIEDENKRKAEIKDRFGKIQSRIIEIGKEFPELTTKELNSKVDYDDRVFLRMNDKPLREFIKELILKGEIRATFIVEDDIIKFSY